MKWQDGRRGGNLEDKRGMSGGQKLTLGGVAGVIVLLIGLFMGGDPRQLLQQLQEQTQQGGEANGEAYQSTPKEDNLIAFADVVLTSTDDVWTAIFEEQGQVYQKPTLTVYNGSTETAGCGMGKSAYGPFYCPGDQKIYLDLSFSDELSQRYGAKGEFALAYVIAHEVGHHIQQLVGTLAETNARRRKLSERAANKLSVMTELQADFYAGVWAHHVQRVSNIELTYEDIRDGMTAAAAVGDDRLQEQAQGQVNPESFTHGTSQQRVFWFKKGYETGDFSLGDTFSDRSLQ